MSTQRRNTVKFLRWYFLVLSSFLPIRNPKEALLGSLGLSSVELSLLGSWKIIMGTTPEIPPNFAEIINISTLLNMHTWWHWLAVLWSAFRLTLFNLVLTEHVNTVWRINVATRTKREREWRQRTRSLCVARVSPLRVNRGHRSLLSRAAINSPYNFKRRVSRREDIF